MAFADDLVLLSLSMCALCKLLDICANFAKEFNMVFNPKKVKWVSYSPTQPCGSLSLGGKPIEQVQVFIHVG